MLPDLSHLLTFLQVTLLLFVIIVGRYFLVAGIFYAVFYAWLPRKWDARKINKKTYAPGQFRKEMLRSTVSAMIFAFAGSVSMLLWQRSYIKVYIPVHEYPLWWLPVSMVLLLLLHETYYYWLHRWMHLPKIFRLVHKAHHDSHIASPWTAFSFHPLECLIQALFLPLVLLIVPVHVAVLLLLLVFMTLSSVINHLNIEVYPQHFHRHFIGKWLIGATHHALHHKQYKYNFGLYFTFWDRWKQTESPNYERVFAEKTALPGNLDT